jgi:hypothetical protein
VEEVIFLEDRHYYYKNHKPEEEVVDIQLLAFFHNLIDSSFHSFAGS